jgi:putative ABC transport system permease protein
VHGIRLKRGRLFDDHDRAGSEMVVIVSEAFAERVWPGEEPVGQRVKWGIRESPNPWMRVVGVVGDVKEAALDTDADLHAYQPWEQVDDETLARPFYRTMTVSLRTSGDPRSVAAPLRDATRELDPALAVSKMSTMEERVAEASAPERMSAVMMTGFAGAALLMAVVGLYGIQAYGVTRRFREFGVRVALGARTWDIVGPVVKQGLVLAMLGLAIGMSCAMALARLVQSLLYRVAPHDPITIAAVPIVMVLVSLVACYLPARGAARIDPISALRVE